MKVNILIVEEIAKRILNSIESEWNLTIHDYCVCLSAAYVVVKDKYGKRAIGFAHIPVEDLHYYSDVKEPSIDNVLEAVIDLNPITRTLAISLLNAISSYIMDRYGYDLGSMDKGIDVIEEFVRGEPEATMR
jgi:uncharacterized protein (DUF4213/DUF364 family)